MESFHEEQAFDVKLLGELVENHLDEAAQNLRHIDTMISHSLVGEQDYARYAAMIARDHFDDFTAVMVLGYDGTTFYDSRGTRADNPLTDAGINKVHLRPGVGVFLSERVVRQDGAITTYLFYAPQIPKGEKKPYIVCGELNLRSFLKKEIAGFLGASIGFVFADYSGDIYAISSSFLEEESPMERGELFDLDEACLECHAPDHFQDLQRAVETGEVVHHVYQSPEGRLLNRASGTFDLYNARWIVSLSRPYDEIQGHILANSVRNGAASLILLFFIGAGAFTVHRLERSKALQEQYYDIVDSISVGVFRMDEEGRILNANPALADLLGVASRGELTAGANFFSWCDDPQASVLIIDTLRETGRLRDVDLVMRRAGGGSFRASLSSTVHRKDPSGPYVMDAVLLDITLRKNVEEDLRIATAELERQNWELKEVDRMKDRLVRDVSHELKTPVAKTAMQLEILKPLLKEHTLTGAEKSAFGVLEASTKRQQGVIKNLLDLARLESGVREYGKEDVRIDRFFEDLERDFAPILGAAGCDDET